MGIWPSDRRVPRGRPTQDNQKVSGETESPGVPAFLLEALDAVYRLGRERPPASLGQLAKRLGIGKAAATERVLALQARGLVRSNLSGHVFVSVAGERIALGLIRTHRLLECFFADCLKLSWERVHEEACRLTPMISADVADGLARLLGSPERCPHGNAIPALDGPVLAEAGVPLHELRPGQEAIVLRVEREEPELLRYLATLGLLPQTKLEVEEQAPFGGPILVRVGSARYALGRKVASHIIVREL
jgi:DtxR family transcriptional regulator, Mn-dependent transcriptional regulator